MGRTRGSDLENRLRSRRDPLLARGIPSRAADRIAALGELTTCREIALLHNGEERVANTVIRYMALGETSRLLPAIRALDDRQSEGGWGPVAIGILRNRYLQLQRDLVRTVTIGAEVRLGIDRVAMRLGRRRLQTLQAVMDHILGEHPNLGALMVAEERVRAWTAEAAAEQSES